MMHALKDQKFSTLTTFSPVVDDFILVGVFSKPEDCEEAAKFYRSSDYHGNVACIQLLAMPDILELLLKGRLHDIAEPLTRLMKAFESIK